MVASGTEPELTYFGKVLDLLELSALSSVVPKLPQTTDRVHDTGFHGLRSTVGTSTITNVPQMILTLIEAAMLWIMAMVSLWVLGLSGLGCRGRRKPCCSGSLYRLRLCIGWPLLELETFSEEGVSVLCEVRSETANPESLSC